MDRLDFHPLANEYRLMDGEAAEALALSITSHGLREPIVLHEGKILDGRNRYIACNIAGVEPRYRQFGDDPNDGDDPAAFVADRNDERLHDESEKARRRRSDRMERIRGRRERGESIPMIAEAEGISQAQVRRDIEDGTLPGGGKVKPTNGTVTGKDGRQQPASRPKTPTSERDTQRPKKRFVNELPPVLDALEQPVPDRLRDVFADPCLGEAEALLDGWAKSLSYDSILNRIRARMDLLPYLRYADLIEQLDAAAAALSIALETVRAGRPFALCPLCQGKSCAQCRLSGYTPRWRHEELTSQHGEEAEL